MIKTFKNEDHVPTIQEKPFYDLTMLQLGNLAKYGQDQEVGLQFCILVHTKERAAGGGRRSVGACSGGGGRGEPPR